jgi:hypothetical protein
MKYFKNAIGVEPKVVCSPCFKHDFRPCIKGFPSPCYTQVNVEHVLQAVDFLKYKFTKSHFNFMSSFLKAPDISEIQQYMLSADKGLCFFPGYFKMDNAIRVDTNKFVGADITDLSTEFKRDSFPFVLYMNNFSQQAIPTYQGTKSLVRPGGYYILYRDGAPSQFFEELKKDLGKSFILLHTKLDPVSQVAIIVGKKPY